VIPRVYNDFARGQEIDQERDQQRIGVDNARYRIMVRIYGMGVMIWMIERWLGKDKMGAGMRVMGTTPSTPTKPG
jgi:hypothetical protein